MTPEEKEKARADFVAQLEGMVNALALQRRQLRRAYFWNTVLSLWAIVSVALWTWRLADVCRW